MDAVRFDALSRSLTRARSRRGALGSLLGATLGLVGLDRTEAKKKCPPCKKRKKGKCKKNKPDGTACPGGTCRRGVCQPSGNPPVDPCPGQKRCNGGCIPTDECCTRADCPAGSLCCNGACSNSLGAPGERCLSDTTCCSAYCRRSAEPLVNDKSCGATCRGKPCTQASDCCRGESCLNRDSTTGSGTCGGCKVFGSVCTSASECCYTDCTEALANPAAKTCLSYPGGPCEYSLDCWSCQHENKCGDTSSGSFRPICHVGICGCPYECCESKECPPEKICFTDDRGLNGECRPIVP